MSFLMYQRSDPRNKDWPPIVTQQIRLRNVIQIIGINIDSNASVSRISSPSKSPSHYSKNPETQGSTVSSPASEGSQEDIYFTLHFRPMSVPFYTSSKLKIERRTNKTKNKVLVWKEIEPRDISDAVRLSTTGCIVCVWSAVTTQPSTAVMTWGVFFQGLYYLGSKPEWNPKDFKPNTLIFRAPFGYFTSLEAFVRKPANTQRFVYLQVPSVFCKPSYTVKSLANLHSFQRSVLEEAEAARQLKSMIAFHGYSPELSRTASNSATSSFHSSLMINEKVIARIHQGRTSLRLKEEIQNLKLKIDVLREEKKKALGRVSTLKEERASQEINNNSLDLLNRMQSLGREKSRLFQLKVLVQEKKRLLTELSSKLFTRRKQLISELLLIYPINLVEGSKRYSINEVQLPNAEDYGNEGGGQISVALGYTAHMVAMLSFFLGIPLRYPISHFGSRSRIIDHITVQIPEKEREFPLYFRNREDVYSKYAVYLLNKNIAQLRWYCGLSTSDLRAALPNLVNLLASRLTIPGWPPSPGESLEIAQELTEEVDEQLLRNDNSLSLDKGLDQIESHGKEVENGWFRSSFSDFEFASGHVVPSGEVRHSRAQDKFLDRWRKRTYESEDVDSNWLINSLNLDFDAGRRLSTSSSVSLSIPSKLTPMIFLNDDGLQQARARRHGRIEKQHQNGIDLLTIPDFSKLTASSSSTPNENMSQVENHLKQLERKRSFCSDIGRPRFYERRRHSSFAEAPLTKESEETEKDRSEEKAADLTRRLSLEEMCLNRSRTPDLRVSHDKRTGSDEEINVELAGLVVENDKEEGLEPELSERQLLYSKPESPAHLSTKYCGHSSGDERGDTPSPSFLRKSSKQQDIVNQSVECSKTLEEITENILNITSATGDGPVSQLANGQLPVPIPGESVSYDNMPVPPKEDRSLNAKFLDDDNDNDDEKDMTLLGTAAAFQTSDELDDSSLWFRTEALVTNTKSFNMVKRRISDSN